MLQKKLITVGKFFKHSKTYLFYLFEANKYFVISGNTYKYIKVVKCLRNTYISIFFSCVENFFIINKIYLLTKYIYIYFRN